MKLSPLVLSLFSSAILAQVAPLPPTNLMVDGLAATPIANNAGVRQGESPTDVCTTAMVGAHATYNVGPGKTYTELDAVPFGLLIAGDVVNIFARPTPYKAKFGLRGQGTAVNPIVVNGVTDATCNKPVLDFDGARTAAGSAAAFSSTPAYGESLAGIIVKRGPNDAYGSYEPKFIVIQGLQVQGARNGATYTTLAGGQATYSSAACIWVQSGQDIVIRNNSVTDCGFGIFMMAKDNLLSETTLRVLIANNRVFGNGVVGSYLEHGFYVQAASPIIEGNYIGKNRSGSLGSSYKSRSSGEIFRRNYVVCTARCLDLVHSEEQTNGIAAQSSYGTDYVYANSIVSTGPEAVHYGGDNVGEQDASATVFVPSLPYRRRLRFWDNSYTLTTSAYRAWVFALSEKATEVDAWGNSFTLNFTGSEISWLTYAGQLRLGPGNTVQGSNPSPARTDAINDGRYSVTTVSALPTDPQLAALK